MTRLQRSLNWGIVSGDLRPFPNVEHREAMHREAVRLVEGLELTAGVFAGDPYQTPAPERHPPGAARRAYLHVDELIDEELKLPEGERLDLVSLLAPIELRCPLARLLLLAGFHVLCEKPLSHSLAEAYELRRLVDGSRQIFALNHSLTGYPMVRLARDMVRQGDLGVVHQVIVQCPQLALTPKHDDVELIVQNVATQAENLVEFVTGQKISMVCAEGAFSSAHPRTGAKLLMRLAKGGRGVLETGSPASGEEGGLTLWVHGLQAALEWRQQHADLLYFKRPKAPVEVWRSGGNRPLPQASRATGQVGAFANIYAGAASAIHTRLKGKQPTPTAPEFPAVEEGIRALLLGETMLKSVQAHNTWIKMPL